MFDFKFDWKPDMKLGIEVIDTQHKQLFGIGRDLEQLIQIKCIGITDKELLNIICRLREFTSYHCYTEEALMDEISYKEAEAHKKLHKDMVDQIMGISIPQLKEEPLKMLTTIRDAIQQEIFTHLLGEDRKLAKACNAYYEKQEKAKVPEKKTAKDSFEEMYGPKIFELDVTNVYLYKEQSNKGRLVVVNREKTKAIVKMPTLERNIFFTDVSRAAKAVQAAFSPDAFDYSYYGDISEQVAMHIVPKYKSRPDWGTPFRLEGEGYYPDGDTLERIAQIIRDSLK